jgi:hypothetical protein
VLGGWWRDIHNINGDRTMSKDKQKHPQGSPSQGTNQNNLKEVYKELCTTYRAIDDFRMKLLGFLSLATGTGIFLLKDILTGDAQQFLLPIGAFGFLITLGLFSYEIYGLKKCHALIKTGKQMEGSLSVDGQFKCRPREVLLIINESFAASVIYPTVLAAWTFLALIFYRGRPNTDLLVASLIASFVWIVFFLITYLYEWKLRKEDRIALNMTY